MGVSPSSSASSSACCVGVRPPAAGALGADETALTAGDFHGVGAENDTGLTSCLTELELVRAGACEAGGGGGGGKSSEPCEDEVSTSALPGLKSNRRQSHYLTVFVLKCKALSVME